MAVVEATWKRSALHLRLTGRLADPHGPIEVVTDGATQVLTPRLTDAILDDPVDVSGRLGELRLQITLTDPGSAIEWRPSTTTDEAAAGGATAGASPLVAAATAVVDPARAAAGGGLGSATWHVAGRLTGLGVDRTASVVGPAELPDPALLADGRILVADMTPDGALVLRLGPGTLSDVVQADGLARQRGDGRTLMVRLPLAGDPRSPSRPVVVAFERPGQRVTRAGRLEAIGDHWHVVVASGPLRGRLRRGRCTASVALDGPDGPWTGVGDVRVDGLGRVHFPDQRPLAMGTIARRQVRRAGRSLKRYVPAPVRAWIRRRRQAPRPGAGG